MDTRDCPGLRALHLLAHDVGWDGLKLGAHDPLVQSELKLLATIDGKSWRRSQVRMEKK